MVLKPVGDLILRIGNFPNLLFNTVQSLGDWLYKIVQGSLNDVGQPFEIIGCNAAFVSDPLHKDELLTSTHPKIEVLSNVDGAAKSGF